MDSNIGKKLDGRYELLELIGVGGMADIYKAKDITEDRIVAVKILKNEFAGSEDFLRRFRNESKAIALLSHPNIVKIYDVGFTDKIQFIVMEYIDGITLTEYIERQGVLKWRDAVHFTLQILKALQHAHDRGIVHRDIKSQNVMLMSDGTIKVMDFGIARFNRETDKTISEKAIGSVHYISPEQARGDITDEKSDIYSVGVMLYEMLTGQKPFDGDNPVSIALMHMQSQPKRPTEINSSIPEGLEEIVIKAMQKEPSKRYQTAGEMIKDIEEFKKNPSIVFEYKYFSADGSTKYFDKVSQPEPEQPKRRTEMRKYKDEEEYEDVDDDEYDEDEDDDDDEVRERRSPLLPILFAVASVFVIMTAWLIYEIVTQNIGDIVAEGGEEIKMPYLIGMTWDEAISQYDYLNIEAVQEYSSEYDKYVIMDQSVAAGRTIKENNKITVTVSNGPKLVEIDDFTNRPVEEVKTMLKKQGFDVGFTYMESDEVSADFVIKTEPAARSMVEEGSKVICYVSSGAAETLTAVPQMIKLSLASAKARAEEYGIILTIVYEPSTTVEKDHVISQSIDPLEKVEKDTVVEIVVSNGEIPVRESQIKVTMSSSASGKFTFEYYIDGLLQEDMTEIRDISLSKEILWKISGSEVSNYAIMVTSQETGETAKFVEMEVDFTTDPPTKTTIEFNDKVFRQLSNGTIEVTEPTGTTDDIEIDDPNFTDTTEPADTTAPVDNTDDDEIPSDDMIEE